MAATLLASAQLANAQPAPPIDLEEFRKSLTTASDGLPEFDVTLSVRVEGYVDYVDDELEEMVVLEKPRHQFVGRTRQRFSKGRLRVDQLADTFREFEEGESTFTWNGALAMVYTASDARGSIHGSFDNMSTPKGASYMVLFRNHSSRVTYWDRLFAFSDGDVGLEEVGTTLKLSRTRSRGSQPKADSQELQLEFDRAKGPFLSKVTNSVNGHPWYIITNLEWKEVAPNTWLPTKSEMLTHVPDATHPDGYRPSAKTVFEATFNKIESPFPDELFTIDFPDGTLVQDLVQSREYRTGQNGNSYKQLPPRGGPAN
jgi:hypothetical protein